MMRRPSALVLAIRALTGFVTVWCLGCAAYDPLIDMILVGQVDGGMRCASEMTELAHSGTDRGTLAVFANPDEPGGQADFECHCTSCHATAAQTYVFAAAELEPPTAVISSVTEMVSVTRAPIAPPPESGTL